jgi:phosphoribosylanthranilate isomerase
MKLDRVTITGADSAVKAIDLIAFSRDFPFVEWGILFSKQRTGTPRYPDFDWVHKLVQASGVVPMKLSAHLCGRYARQVVVEGENPWEKDLGTASAAPFRRVQLNVSNMGRKPTQRVLELMTRRFGYDQLIIQAKPERLEIWRAVSGREGLWPGILFDSSGGRGKTPDAWPAAVPNAYCGYAGGLGSDNLASQLHLIERAAGVARVWVDMESGVRDDQDAFDLGKVRRALEQAAPWVETAQLTNLAKGEYRHDKIRSGSSGN